MRRVVTFLVAGALIVVAFAALAVATDGDDARVETLAPAAVDDDPTTTRPRRERRAPTAAVATIAPSTEAPPATDAPPATEATEAAQFDGPDPSTCPSTPHGAVVDRARQLAWLCADGAVQVPFPITTAVSQPDPGTYDVYAKDMQTTSSFGEEFSYLDRFVAFTTGKYTGARIAFHAIPRYEDGTLAQSIDSVGQPELFGESAGCIRVRPDDAVMIWDFLAIGDQVRVVT